MSHEHHRHEHDKGFMAKVRWLLKIRSFWQSDTNRAVVDLVDPQPGELVLDIGAGMGPATMLAAGRGSSVVAVDPSGFMRSICGTRRLFQRARGRITVEQYRWDVVADRVIEYYESLLRRRAQREVAS